MTKHSIGRTGLLLLTTVCLAACGNQNQDVGKPAETGAIKPPETGAAKLTESLSREQVIDIAAHHLIGKSFDVTPPATVVQSEGKYTVSFQRPVPNGAPGATYTSKVVFDAKTKEALEIVVSEDDKRVTNAPPVAGSAGTTAPAYRPTPLREEVDHAGELAKQLGVRYEEK